MEAFNVEVCFSEACFGGVFMCLLLSFRHLSLKSKGKDIRGKRGVISMEKPTTSLFLLSCCCVGGITYTGEGDKDRGRR